VSTDVVSAEKAQQVIDAVNAACELGGMSSTEEAAALTMESLARTVLTLHAREAAQATELAVLRAQLAPLLAVHDALVAAAALPGAGASPEAMVAAVRAQGVAAERERCARLCDEVVVDCWARSGVVNGPTYAGAASGAKRCAAKIRAGGV
jgi:hypothetical protein